MMIINKRFATAALALTLALSLSACSNMSKRDRNTAIGAGAGAVGGAVLTGSTLGTLAVRQSVGLSAIRLVNNAPPYLYLTLQMLLNVENGTWR